MISIYALINPISDSVFYIGATSNPELRFRQHYYESARNDKWPYTVVREIIKSGLQIEAIILELCSKKEASFYEEFYLQLFRSFGFHLPQLSKSTYSGNTLDNLPPKYSIRLTKRNTIVAKLEVVKNTTHHVERLEISVDDYDEQVVRDELFNSLPTK